MRHDRIQKILKMSSIKGLALAKGLNFSYAERLGVEDRQELIDSKELFEQEMLNAVENISLPTELAKKLSSLEKQYLELLSAKHLVDMGGTEYSLQMLFQSILWSDNIKKPGDLERELQIRDILSSDNPDEKMLYDFLKLKTLSDLEEDRLKTVDKSNNYKTNDVVFSFNNGWKIVSVPPASDSRVGISMDNDGQNIPCSHDRITEGDHMGHCMGSKEMSFQGAESDIYSLRDPKNEPHATILIEGVKLKQIYGKANTAVSKRYGQMILAWLKTFYTFDSSDATNEYILRLPLSDDDLSSIFAKFNPNLIKIDQPELYEKIMKVYKAKAYEPSNTGLRASFNSLDGGMSFEFLCSYLYSMPIGSNLLGEISVDKINSIDFNADSERYLVNEYAYLFLFIQHNMEADFNDAAKNIFEIIKRRLTTSFNNTVRSINNLDAELAVRLLNIIENDMQQNVWAACLYDIGYKDLSEELRSAYQFFNKITDMDYDYYNFYNMLLVFSL
jgi:hypothetical protein